MPKIIIYKHSDVRLLQNAKSYLQSKIIAYDEKHADLDQSIAQELFDTSGQLGVPFTLSKKRWDRRKEYWFDKNKIDLVLLYFVVHLYSIRDLPIVS